jgi:hypothetical protein
MTLRLSAKPVAKVEESEPPIRQPRLQVETRSPERIKLSEELAVLNRPLADEVEYYDEVPRSRAQPVFAAVMVLAVIGGAGYLFGQRHRADHNAVAPPMRQGEQASSTGASLSASAGTAVVPAKAPATEPVPTRAPIAPIAASPAAEAGSSTSGTPGDLDPEGDPPGPSAAAAGRHAPRPGTKSSPR